MVIKPPKELKMHVIVATGLGIVINQVLDLPLPACMITSALNPEETDAFVCLHHAVRQFLRLITLSFLSVQVLLDMCPFLC